MLLLRCRGGLRGEERRGFRRNPVHQVPRFHETARVGAGAEDDDRALITSFATRDGRYRVAACDVCRRYIKAYDARHANRPVMVSVDSIATLPLDAAAMQRGYVG